jgi:hypothetical protein
MKLAELLKRITPLPWLEVTATDGDKWIGTKEGDDRITSYKVKVKSGRVLVRMTPATPRKKKPHAPHPLARFIRRNRRHVAQTQSRFEQDRARWTQSPTAGSSARQRSLGLN